MLLHLKFYQNVKNYDLGKFNKTYLMNVFYITLKDCFLEHKFSYLPQRPQARWQLYTHLEKDSMPKCFVSMSYIAVWIIWPGCGIYTQGMSLFDKFESIIHELRWWADGISQSQISADFNILHILILKFYF